MSEDLREAEYRARRTTARLNRDEDLGDARAVRNAGDIDSPEKKARIEAIYSQFAAFDAVLLSRRFEAGGDAVTPGNAAPRADVPTATRGDVPLLEQTVYVRVKEGRQVLAPRIGIAAGQTTTYLDLARDAVLHYLRPEDWARVAARPMIVETFSDFHETEASKVEMTIGANAISNINKYIRVTVQSPAPAPAARRNGAGVLMQASRERGYVPVLFEPLEGKELQYPEKLFNDIVDQHVAFCVGVRRDEIIVLTNLNKALRDAIISCEGQKDMVLPETFGHFPSQRTWGNKSRARADARLYERRAGTLQNLAGAPCFAPAAWASIIGDVHKLVDVLTSKFTTMDRDARLAATRRTSIRELVNGRLDVVTIEQTEGGTLACYREPEARIYALDDYQFLVVSTNDVDEYSTKPGVQPEAPESARKRRSRFRDGLAFHHFAVKRFFYVPGGPESGLLILWKLLIADERSETEDAAVQLRVRDMLPVFHSRVMKREFAEQFGSVSTLSTSVMRAIYSKLTSGGSAPLNARDRAVDERVAEFVAANGDVDLWPDLRALNGNKGGKFGEFWAAAADEVAACGVAAADRRGTALFFAQPTSVRDFIERVVERLNEKLLRDQVDDPDAELPPIPPEKWVHFQFMPRNPTHSVATHYTGRLYLKRMVQSRTQRCLHMDDHWCNALNVNVNSFMVRLCIALEDNMHDVAESERPRLSAALSAAGDDKSKVACGEPGHSVSTNVRPSSAVLAHKDVQILALDHDFHRVSFTPSVNLIQDTPDFANESWRKGRLCVTIRDSILYPPNPIRHAAELLKQIRHESADAALPYALRFKTDGGPDHNMSHMSVVVSLVGLARAASFDAVIAHRPAAGSSFRSEGEHGMSTLNMALQHMALERDPMTVEFEDFFRGSASMKAKVLVSEQASGDEIREIIDAVRSIDSTWDETMTTKDAVANCTDLCEFLATHVQRQKYIVEIIKCGEADCTFGCEPPRMPREVFDAIRSVPYPMHTPNSGRDHFEKYDALCSEVTSDLHMPSRTPPTEPTKEAKLLDKARENASFHTTKVRALIECAECNKQRAVFSKSKPTRAVAQCFEAYAEAVIYTCGDPLFAGDGGALAEIFYYVRRGLVCFNPIEKVVYSSKMFPGFCAICGSSDQSVFVIMESEKFKALCGGKKAYPMGESCLEEGFAPVTHGAADKTGGGDAAKKRKKGGARKSAGGDASSSSDDDSAEVVDFTAAAPFAPAPTRGAPAAMRAILEASGKGRGDDAPRAGLAIAMSRATRQATSRAALGGGTGAERAEQGGTLEEGLEGGVADVRRDMRRVLLSQNVGDDLGAQQRVGRGGPLVAKREPLD
ncbi:hypothetical protein M885DRAFT_591824 [Pelagophyceae sp. CCMP2097]|nr:hypothetical protein M885DRAFT_591824 [Pelagophyceae sp. CCMP2097]